MLPAVKGYSQEIDTTSSRYFPLQVGNFWVYKSSYTGPSGIPIISYYKTEVKKDTVINNIKYYNIINFYSLNSEYYRFNPQTGHFVKLSGIQECSLYNLSANLGDSLIETCSHKHVYSEINNVIAFGIFTSQKKYSYSYNSQFTTGGSGFRKFAKNIGLISSIASSYSGPYNHNIWDTLIGCKINGVVYGDTTTTSITKISSQISNFHLSQNYPNPFNPTTKISFSIPQSSFVKLNVYNILGQNVETLVNQNMTTGSYEVEWNAANYPSGVYFYKFETENFSEIKKMILKK